MDGRKRDGEIAAVREKEQEREREREKKNVKGMAAPATSAFHARKKSIIKHIMIFTRKKGTTINCDNRLGIRYST